MHRLNQIIEQSTPLQVKAVEDFAEALVKSESKVDLTRPANIKFDDLIGLCKGMGGDKTDKELLREAWDGVVDKLMSK